MWAWSYMLEIFLLTNLTAVTDKKLFSSLAEWALMFSFLQVICWSQLSYLIALFPYYHFNSSRAYSHVPSFIADNNNLWHLFSLFHLPKLFNLLVFSKISFCCSSLFLSLCLCLYYTLDFDINSFFLFGKTKVCIKYWDNFFLI